MRFLGVKESLVGCVVVCLTIIGLSQIAYLSDTLPTTVARGLTHKSKRGVSALHPGLPQLPRQRKVPHLDLPPAPPLPEDLVLSTDIHLWRGQFANDTTKYPLTQLVFVPPRNNGCPPDQSFVIAVPSAWSEADGRKEYRSQVSLLTGDAVKPIFFLGRPSAEWDMAFMEPIVHEWKTHQDIVLINALDDYEDLALKTTAILEWFVWLCPTTQYLVKADMDTRINFANLISSVVGGWMDSLEAEDDNDQLLYLGTDYEQMDVIYDDTAKNFEDLPDHPKYFPPYNGGPLYVLHQKAARHALTQRLTTTHRRYYRNEDAMIGILLEGIVTAKKLPGIIPFFIKNFLKETCGHEPKTYTDCDCDKWLAYHSNANPHSKGAVLFLLNAALCVAQYTPAHFEAAMQLIATGTTPTPFTP